jgi:hypothetical protein
MATEPIYGRFPLPSAFELGETLSETVRQVNWTHDFDLRLEIEAPVVVYWNLEWTKQAIWLLSEALLPWAEPRGRGILRVEPRDGRVEISLSIAGHPFSREVLADLAEHCRGRSFVGRHSFRRELSSSLTAVRRIAEAHDGFLKLSSSPSEGTAFSISLPAESRS